MEMNTRLQVEHPVTEMVTGQDLVEWQLRVAADEPLPLTQQQLKIDGHAIEARIYAEHPARGFLPSTGTLKHLRMPEGVEFIIDAAGSGESGRKAPVRIDSGVREGDTITPFYDPMIAKLIVHGATREEALARLNRALRACEVVGPHTNVEFLQRIVTSEPFATGDLDTGLIERHHDALVRTGEEALQGSARACVRGVAHARRRQRAWRVAVGCAVALAPERRLHADTRLAHYRRRVTTKAFTVTFARDGSTANARTRRRARRRSLVGAARASTSSARRSATRV